MGLFSRQDTRTTSLETNQISTDNTEFEAEHELKMQASTTKDTANHRHYSRDTIDYLKMHHTRCDSVDQFVSESSHQQTKIQVSFMLEADFLSLERSKRGLQKA